MAASAMASAHLSPASAPDQTATVARVSAPGTPGPVRTHTPGSLDPLGCSHSHSTVRTPGGSNSPETAPSHTSHNHTRRISPRGMSFPRLPPLPCCGRFGSWRQNDIAPAGSICTFPASPRKRRWCCLEVKGRNGGNGRFRGVWEFRRGRRRDVSGSCLDCEDNRGRSWEGGHVTGNRWWVGNSLSTDHRCLIGNSPSIDYSWWTEYSPLIDHSLWTDYNP